MFNKKILQTTALAIRGALIIEVSGGTAQKSVAEQSLTATEIQSHRGRYTITNMIIKGSRLA